MDAIRKFFPFKANAKDVKSLVIAIVIYVVIGVVAGAIIGIFAGIPVLGLIFKIICILIDLYSLAGIALAILDFLEVKI